MGLMRADNRMCLDREVLVRSDPFPNISPVRDHFGLKGAGPRQSRVRKWCISVWRCVCVGLVLAAGFTCVAQDGQPAAVPGTLPNTTPQAQTSSPASAKPSTDPLDKPQFEESTPEPQPPPDTRPRSRISTESTHLLAMAVDLKAEVDKTTKDTLSLNVIRKADAIEKLAKTVKAKMRQSSGPN